MSHNINVHGAARDCNGSSFMNKELSDWPTLYIKLTNFILVNLVYNKYTRQTMMKGNNAMLLFSEAA